MAKKESEIVAQFKVGEKVPDWLLTADPTGPGATPGKLSFTVDCCVVETAFGYVIVPEEMRLPAVRLSSGKNLVISAGSRSVFLIAKGDIIQEVGPGTGRQTRLA